MVGEVCIEKSTLGLEAASVCPSVNTGIAWLRVVLREKKYIFNTGIAWLRVVLREKKYISEEAKVWNRRENYTFLSSGRTSRRSAAKRVNSHAVAVVAESFAV